MTAPRSTVLPLHDRFDVAYLAGGHKRLVDTAVVALLEADKIRVRPNGQLYAVDLHRSHPIEAAVLDAVGTRGRSLVPLRWRLTEDQRIRAVADRLATEGLMTPPGRRGLLRRRITEGARTAEGRRVLRRLRAEDPTGFEVALHGVSRMADAQLRDAVFRVVCPPHTGRRFRGHVADELGSMPGPWWVPVWGGDGGGGHSGGFDGGCGGFDGGGAGHGGGAC
jgi:uncharacterized membrane protein YgcG